jgi:hypothetical protein
MAQSRSIVSHRKRCGLLGTLRGGLTARTANLIHRGRRGRKQMTAMRGSRDKERKESLEGAMMPSVGENEDMKEMRSNEVGFCPI